MQKNEPQDITAIVEVAKQACGINKPNSEMTDDEIRTVCKRVAQYAPDTVWVGGEPVFGRLGISTLLSLALYEFPDFYEKYELCEFN